MTSVLDARIAIALALDDLETVRVSVGSTASTVVAPLLFDGTTGASDARYRGRFLYRRGKPDTDRQRIVRGQGFAPGASTLTFDPNVSVLSLNGETVDLTALFPVEKFGSRDNTSYIEIVDMALASLWVPYDLPVTTVANAYSYSLATSPWFDHPERVLALLDPAIVTGYVPRDGSWRLDRDPDGHARIDVLGGTLTLWVRAPYTANGQTAYLKVRRPSNTIINGVEATGVTLDADTFASELEEVKQVGLLIAYRLLFTRTGAPEWASRAAAQEKLIEGDERIRYIPRAARAAAPPEAA